MTEMLIGLRPLCHNHWWLIWNFSYIIRGLVKKLEDMRSKVLGDGQTTCLICGTKAGLLKDQLRYCTKCSKVCRQSGLKYSIARIVSIF